MILTRFQLTQIRAADFDFNAGFLDRMADGMREFLTSDGTISAEQSPGPLTELRENRTLLLLVLDGAKERTTAADQSRTDGIVALIHMMANLENLCQRKTGLTLAELDEQFALADVAEENPAPPAPASEAALIDESQASIRESIGRHIVDGCNLIRHAGPPPLPPLQERIARDAWNVATDTHRHISGLPMLDTATMDALTDLQTLIDALRNLLP